jgi:hypothetical protein
MRKLLSGGVIGVILVIPNAYMRFSRVKTLPTKTRFNKEIIDDENLGYLL